VPKLEYNGKRVLDESSHLGDLIVGLEVILRLLSKRRL
jgi:hypothetical protein